MHMRVYKFVPVAHWYEAQVAMDKHRSIESSRMNPESNSVLANYVFTRFT